MKLPIKIALSAVIFLILNACSPAETRRASAPRHSAQTIAGFMAVLSREIVGLDDIDLRRAAEAQLVSLEFGRAGQPTPWRNPDSGNHGEVIPGPGILPPTRGTCRGLRHTLYLRGRSQTVVMEACRDEAGNWTKR